VDATLCEAIRTRHVVQFLYDGHLRVVEPHMVVANELHHYALSGWFVSGYSHETQPGWREYLLSGIANLQITDATLPGPRPGYNASGGRKFPRVHCRL
jgi:predicted DNA-binding transcriptional regulator YafY